MALLEASATLAVNGISRWLPTLISLKFYVIDT